MSKTILELKHRIDENRKPVDFWIVLPYELKEGRTGLSVLALQVDNVLDESDDAGGKWNCTDIAGQLKMKLTKSGFKPLKQGLQL